MNTKKSVFFAAFIVTVVLVSLFFIAQIQYCNYHYDGYETLCMRAFGYIEQVLEPLSFSLFLAPLFFLISLITYRMKDEVFLAWWRFARWWVPVIMIVTFLLENAGGGGTLGMNKDFTALILIILYSILIVTSLVKIMRAYFGARW
jgi:hypothetical protein